MNPFMLMPSERLDEWTAFRDRLPSLSESEQLEQVCRWWGLAPLKKRSLDPLDPKSWMTVWEMLHSGDMCQNSIAIAMESTLRLSGWDPKRLTLQMVHSDEENADFIVVKIDDEYLLNYSYATPIYLDADIRNDISVEFEIQYAGRAYKFNK
jgi:hypothetical protein